MKLKPLFVAACLMIVFTFRVNAQIPRDIVIYPDTVREFTPEQDYIVPEGILVRVLDSMGTLKMWSVTTKRNELTNGYQSLFNLETGMIEAQIHYKDGVQDGECYYWNSKGELIKKELWRKGKLISKKKKG